MEGGVFIGVESFHFETWVPDQEEIIVFYEQNNLSQDQYLSRMTRSCFVMNPEQFLHFRESHPHYTKRALYANRPKELKSTKRVYFHPLMVTEYIDDDIGWRSRLLYDSERITTVFLSGRGKLVPLFLLEEGEH